MSKNNNTVLMVNIDHILGKTIHRSCKAMSVKNREGATSKEIRDAVISIFDEAKKEIENVSLTLRNHDKDTPIYETIR